MNSVPLPLSVFSVPNWLVPASTNRLAVAAQGTAPITMDIQQGFGDPDVLGVSSGNNSAAVMTDPELAPGSTSRSRTPPGRSSPAPPGR